MKSTTIHDFRTTALINDRNVMLNSMNADGTIDVVLAGVLPLQHDHVLLTVSQDNTDTDTQWTVVTVKEGTDHSKMVCHAILKFEKNI